MLGRKQDSQNVPQHNIWKEKQTVQPRTCRNTIKKRKEKNQPGQPRTCQTYHIFFIWKEKQTGKSIIWHNTIFPFLFINCVLACSWLLRFFFLSCIVLWHILDCLMCFSFHISCFGCPVCFSFHVLFWHVLVALFVFSSPGQSPTVHLSVYLVIVVQLSICQYVLW